MLVIGCAKCGVTVWPIPCAAPGVAVAMARAAQVALMMVRIFMEFLLLLTGWYLKSGTNADDRLSLASLGRVQGGHRFVEGRDVANVRPQSSVPHPLDD